jgi:transcriptional regulator with XRE-family HTH domain
MTSQEMTWVGLAIVAIIVVAFAAVALWRTNKKKQQADLARRFGPEYDRVLNEKGSPTLANRELEARAKRVSKLPIKELSDGERQSFSEAWRQTQERFVDTPLIAVRSAHDLVQQVMRSRGYPVDDFDQRIADLSVDHAGVVEHYRAADGLHRKNQSGQANTEELRQAMMHYRALFGDLLGTPDRAPDSRHLRPAHA